ncbi:hypothetical protein BDU57DRAFT_596135 [Ampelomyces quisqualis]|uniref:Uncharacterized protein n=1 Tax=Ampelomyces quisqualis TaxID=50730 RepID=A0A6A5QLY2_AMPQU|nr:hypothetical protein BDU57DRAFT_596135 [Ampelomyces quisqualis]
MRCSLVVVALLWSMNAATVSRDARCGKGFDTSCLSSNYGSCSSSSTRPLSTMRTSFMIRSSSAVRSVSSSTRVLPSSTRVSSTSARPLMPSHSTLQTPTPTPKSTPANAQGVTNPSFEDGLLTWRFQGSNNANVAASGVREGEAYTGRNCYRAVGAQDSWFLDIVQKVAAAPDTSYLKEAWGKMATGVAEQCTIGISYLVADSFDLTTSYTKGLFLVLVTAVTVQSIADSQGELLVDIICRGKDWDSKLFT